MGPRSLGGQPFLRRGRPAGGDDDGSGGKPNPFWSDGVCVLALRRSRRLAPPSFAGSARRRSRGSWSAARGAARATRRAMNRAQSAPRTGCAACSEASCAWNADSICARASRSATGRAIRFLCAGSPSGHPVCSRCPAAICPAGQLDVVERPQAALDDRRADGGEPRRRSRRAHDQVEDLKPGWSSAPMSPKVHREARRFTVPALDPAIAVGDGGKVGYLWRP